MQEAWLPELSRFLREGFQIPDPDAAAFSPGSLRWKYLEPRHRWPGPRSFVARQNGRITAHAGITTTEFVAPSDLSLAVSAVHPVDWLSGAPGGVLGTMVALRAMSQGEVQYSLGSTEIGQKVLLGCGFKEIQPARFACKVFRLQKPAVWRFLHGPHRTAKQAALLGTDLLQSLLARFRTAGAESVTIRSVRQFGEEAAGIFRGCKLSLTCTSRAPELLNYFLRFPQGTVTGWLIERAGALAGFALLSVIERRGVRLGNIVECFLADDDPEVWRAAVARLTAQLQSQHCDLVRCLGTVPWLRAALKRNRFFFRGRCSLFLRDPRARVPLHRSFLLSDLDADGGY